MTLVNAETGEKVEVLLNESEALALTAKIKAYTAEAWVLLKKAHDGQAWRALGYTSWRSYVLAEFDIGKSQAYRLIAHANAVFELADAAGLDPEVSPMGDTLTERQTRNLDLPAAADAVRAAVADLPSDASDDDRAAAATETVRSLTERTKTSAPASPQAASEEAAGPQGVVGRGSDDTGGNGSPPAPGVVPSPALETAAHRERIGRALAKTSDLLALDPAEAAAVMAQDDAPVWCTAADDLADWAHEFSQAVIANRHLRSVR